VADVSETSRVSGGAPSRDAAAVDVVLVVPTGKTCSRMKNMPLETRSSMVLCQHASFTLPTVISGTYALHRQSAFAGVVEERSPRVIEEDVRHDLGAHNS
jgi:hypothetical protein